ncbi:MAG: glutamate 5-kinase [Candidatus Oxydemutatoraceae bacterium WSBS_2016_MAG_OTU14]
MQRQQDINIKNMSRWVIKIGSSLVTDDGRGLCLDRIHDWAEQISALKQSGVSVVLVSSGAVAEGVHRLGLKDLPVKRHAIQAAAAVGQMGLVHAYESTFQKHALGAAQILLTHDDLTNRERYLNARHTFSALLDLNMIPVVNENDSVATEEIQFGDNDRLASMVSNLIDADLLLILTNQDGLYSKDPAVYPDACFIEEALVDDPNLDDFAVSSKSYFGRGGMKTKLAAALQAARSGTTTIIANGMMDAVIKRIAAGEKIGTLLQAPYRPVTAKKQWLCNLNPTASLVIDDGAYDALLQGKSLLPVGVVKAESKFKRGDIVACYSKGNKKVAQGLVNFSIDETIKIMGKRSNEVKMILGKAYESEIIHRDNLAILDPKGES